MLKRATRQEDGFTLIELLVVIIIIGILAAIAVPVFLNQRQRANDSAVQAAINSYVKATESYLIPNPNLGSFGNDATHLQGIVNEGARKSEGVHIMVRGTGTYYAYCAWHDNGKDYSSRNKGLYYDSGRGDSRPADCDAASNWWTVIS